MNRPFDTGMAPHYSPSVTVGGVMRQVLYALVPGIAAHAWFFGPGVLFQILLAAVFAIGLEALALMVRRKPVRLFLGDYSAVVTAVLFALCVPPLAPWWIALVGMVFAILIAKHLYGGLGGNLFNPAMVGYVVVLVSFPQVMTAWLPASGITGQAPGWVDSALTIIAGQPPGGVGWDAISSATLLDAIRNSASTGVSIESLRGTAVFGSAAGRGWEWVALGYALGGAWLLARRVISWQVPAAVIGSALALGALAWLADPGHNPSPIIDLLSGALVLGAFFIATDPVSGCTSPKGRLFFGAGVGILTIVIRRWGGYPDGLAFAVLLMNMAAPLIDRFTRPRIFGHERQ
jgi:electron transport complex protein RnfD